MLKQKFAIQFGTNIFIKVISMFAGIIVARIAGPGVLGTLSYGLSFVSIWGFLNTMFGAAHMKLVSEGQNQGNCMSTYIYLKGISVLVFIIVVLVWLAFQFYSNRLSFESSEQIYVILILLGVVIVTEFYRIITNSYTAMLMQAKANFPTIIKTLVYQSGRIVVVLLGAKAIGLSFWNLLALIIIVPLLIKYYRDLPYGKWDKELAKKYYKYGAPTLLTAIIASIIQHTDKLILAHFTNIQELGYYAAAMSIGGTFLLLSSSIGSVFFPLFSKLISENNWEMVNRKNSVYQTFNALFILPCIAIIVIIAEPLLITFLGNKYIASVVPFQIIVASTYLVITGMPYGNIITGMGRFYVNLWINASHLIVFIFSVIFFVSPQYLDLGATGLALNLMITYVYKNIAYIIVSNRIGSLKYDWINLFRIIIVLGISLFFYELSESFQNISYWWLYIIPLYLCATYGILYSSRLLRKGHITTLLQIISLRKAKQYVKSEL